jgi:hypothetical protein
VLACRIYPRSDLELKVVAGMKKTLLRHAPAAARKEAAERRRPGLFRTELARIGHGAA